MCYTDGLVQRNVLGSALWSGSYLCGTSGHERQMPLEVFDICSTVARIILHDFYKVFLQDSSPSGWLDDSRTLSLQADLNQYWPSLLKNDSFKFWKNEWYKHGTCGTCADSMSCPDKYFSLALELRTKFSIDKSLAAAGIKPSCNYSYTYQHIQSALVYLGTHVNLQCYIHKKQQILMQIKIPLSKDLSTGCHSDEENVSKTYYKPCSKKSEIYLYPFTTHPHNPCS
ncbi:ribonuclease T2-like isoform X4 [Scyliorhinus canicula]|uniref:ribonuclease T2-like isoform X4 n=1 Tax=Scyliorhinus canicula TaxID=7830 RepID=UPI0018F37EF9|nr:ribonuclease T2-like isoform X4 [Scyliorhinus canicula]